MGAEGASRRWRWAMELIIVHLSDAASRSCASPARHTQLTAHSLILAQDTDAIYPDRSQGHARP